MGHSRHNQNEEISDDYDPTPYQGGYNQAEVYGPVKLLDEVTTYAPPAFGELAEGGYGHHDSPYATGGPGSSGYSTYHQRSEPHFESAQSDYHGGARYGGRRPSKGEPFEASYDGEGEWQDSSTRVQQQHHGYRKPTLAYGQSEQGSEYAGGYDQEPPSGYGGRQEQVWRGEQQEERIPSGYGHPHHKHHGEEDEQQQQQEGYYWGRGGRASAGSSSIGGHSSGENQPGNLVNLRY
ncbi:unnamed protein product [Sphagnum jensenii]|uniref:Dehydrin n=1 Tax=Sphagnum jensenii TaxID=128206 RepID=A0ABP0VKY3_9BRYO